ncbi:hypothetical protein MBGDF03_00849 [Thermoplasmatales archaeon SCGC AB-540-F20]|nr:hypothetical protein MBGDF03_00849 [Thermoplasmatales archaeon SCGC AB-540-F20]
MKRIIPIVVVSILVLGGLGAVALPEPEEDIEPLNTEDWKLVIDIKGGFLGYTVTVENVGNETVTGNFSTKIITDMMVGMFGYEYDTFIDPIKFVPNEPIKYRVNPVIGFGPATIKVSGVFSPGGWGFDAEANGFVLLFYVIASFDPITIPPR